MNKVVERSDRHDPFGKLDYLSIQHLERYRFACELLEPGQKVLDVACGTGYGTDTLVNHGCDAIGADIDDGILEEAKKKWGHSEFRKADVLNLPFEDELFDAVVSFETIEHVTDGERFLSEMNRVLKTGGIFICSTPNIKYTAHPQFHLKEYKPGEYFDLIGSCFSDVQRYGQYFKLGDRVQDLLRWRVRTRLVKLIETMKLRHLIKGLLAKREANTREGLVGNMGSDGANHREHSKAQSSGYNCYSVIPLEGLRLLRIMLVVGLKKSSSAPAAKIRQHRGNAV